MQIQLLKSFLLLTLLLSCKSGKTREHDSSLKFLGLRGKQAHFVDQKAFNKYIEKTVLKTKDRNGRVLLQLDWEIWPTIEDKTFIDYSYINKHNKLNISTQLVPRQQVRIDSLAQVDHSYSSKTINFINYITPQNDSDSIYWMLHPYVDQSDRVVYPFREVELSDYEIPSIRTASRTLVTKFDDYWYGIKLGVKTPFGPSESTWAQPRKELLSGEEVMGMSRYLDFMRKIAVKQVNRPAVSIDFTLAILRLTVRSDQSSGTIGREILVRDHEAISDGSYYLPAHTIPSFGDRLVHYLLEKQPNESYAAFNFEKFWGKWWAEKMGQWMAITLWNYGITIAVNPQNFLIQLDESLNPTGKIVGRDIQSYSLYFPDKLRAQLSSKSLENHNLSVKNRLATNCYLFSLSGKFELSSSGAWNQDIGTDWQNRCKFSFIKELALLMKEYSRSSDYDQIVNMNYRDFEPQIGVVSNRATKAHPLEEQLMKSDLLIYRLRELYNSYLQAHK